MNLDLLGFNLPQNKLVYFGSKRYYKPRKRISGCEDITKLG